jgi:hypothetical protein
MITNRGSTEEGYTTQDRCDYKTREMSFSIPTIFYDTSTIASEHYMTFQKKWGFFSYTFLKKLGEFTMVSQPIRLILVDWFVFNFF